LSPRLVRDEAGNGYFAVFTRREPLEEAAASLGWTDESSSLQYCTMPALLVFDLALQIVDESNIVAMVIDPGHDNELVLQRHEIGSIAQRRAIPLVGYVSQIPAESAERTLVAEGEPPPAALVAAVQKCVAGLGIVESFRIERTFNPERDLEPHPTLLLTLKKDGGDRQFVVKRLMEAVEGKVPPPGYIDIVFDEDLD
jgi:hypothetical protein